jgi:phage tail-like protein
MHRLNGSLSAERKDIMGGLLLKKEKLTKPAYAESLKPLTDFEEIPIPAYQFSIEFGTDTMALFQTISELEVKRDTETVIEGGLNAYAYEFPGHISYAHITLETGLTSSDFFWKWMMDGQLGGWAKAMNFTLVQRRPAPNEYKIVRKWNFYNAYPVKWKIADLTVESQKIAIEKLELTFDYFEMGSV